MRTEAVNEAWSDYWKAVSDATAQVRIAHTALKVELALLGARDPDDESDLPDTDPAHTPRAEARSQCSDDDPHWTVQP